MISKGDIVAFIHEDGTPGEGQPHRVLYVSGRRVDVRAIRENGRTFGATFTGMPEDFRPYNDNDRQRWE